MDTHFIETREFEWKLHNFTKELAKCNKYFRTDKFSIFLDNKETNLNFLIQIREPNFGLFIQLKESETADFALTFEIFVKKLNEEKTNNRILLRTSNEFKIDKGFGFGWDKFISIDDICNNSHQYLKDNNTLTLGLKVELTKKKESPTCQCDNEYQRMCKEYFTTKTFSDFTIKCSDGEKIPAHKFILAAFSSVIKTMINSNMIESESNTVNITDIDEETMTEILRFIYTREVNKIKELAVKLLYGAEKYELDKLKKLCIASMIENLSVENALDYFILADKYNSKALLFRSAVFIKLKYNTLRNKDWSKLTRRLLRKLLDNYQHIPGEVKVFEHTF